MSSDKKLAKKLTQEKTFVKRSKRVKQSVRSPKSGAREKGKFIRSVTKGRISTKKK